MIFCVTIGVITVFLAFLTRYRSCKYGLELAFFILTIFLAIRYNWGSDYPNYLATFDRINKLNNLSLENLLYVVNNEEGEIGWIIINILFYPLGFFGMVIFLTCFENYVLYLFIKRYVGKKWYWLAVFLFVFSSSFMITGCSMMRQYLAMILFIMSIQHIIKGNLWRFAIIIFIATTIHSTAFMLFLMYFLRYLRLNVNIKKMLFFIILYLSWNILVNLLLSRFVGKLFILDRFEQYEKYLGDEGEGIKTGIGIFFYILMAFFSIYYCNFVEEKKKVIIYLSFFSVAFFPFYSLVPLVSRLAMYFSCLSVVTYPIVFSKISNKFFLNLLLFSLVFLTLKGFFQFFDSPIWHDSIINYSTILSAPYWR